MYTWWILHRQYPKRSFFRNSSLRYLISTSSKKKFLIKKNRAARGGRQILQLLIVRVLSATLYDCVVLIPPHNFLKQTTKQMEFGSVERISLLRMSGNGWRRGSHSPTPAGRPGNPVTTIGSELTRIVWTSCLTFGMTRVACGRWISFAKRCLFFRLSLRAANFRPLLGIYSFWSGAWKGIKFVSPALTLRFDLSGLIRRMTIRI